MAISLVRNVGSNSQTNGTVATVTVATTAIPVGNLVIARTRSGTAPTIADTRSNTWNTLGSSGNTYYWYSFVTTQIGVGDTITVTRGTKGEISLMCDEFNGVSSIDGTYDLQTATSTTPSAAVSTSGAERLIIALLKIESGNADAFTQDSDTDGGASWSALSTASVAGSSCIRGAYKVTVSSATQTYDPTLGTSRAWIESVSAFSPPGAPFIAKRPYSVQQAVNRAATY